MATSMPVHRIVAIWLFLVTMSPPCEPRSARAEESPELAPRSLPIPATQWTPTTHRFLAAAMIAEAGWKAKRDHVAIAYVLAHRWSRGLRRFPTRTFLDQVAGYVAAYDGSNAKKARTRWLLGLNEAGDPPALWPHNKAKWSVHKPLWFAALQRVEDWAQGKLRDPCRGRAVHWGGDMDVPKGRMIEVDCGDTRNTFYQLAPRMSRGGW